MRRTSGRAAVTVVALLLGFLVVVQLRSQSAEEGLGNLSVQDLTILIANLNTRNAQLDAEVQALQRQRLSLSNSVDRGGTTLDQIRSDLARVRGWSGVSAVTGPGLVIAVAGPVSADGVNQLLNELRNASAEAVSIDGIRIVSGVSMTGDPGSLLVDGHPVANPMLITVVGQQETIVGSLTRTGGPIAQLGARFPDVLVTVTPQDVVKLPATDRDISPNLARPRL